MKKIQDWVTIVLFCAVLTGLAGLAWVKAPAGYSNTERRSLAQLPALNSSTIVSGRFMTQFDDYATDQFPLRDGFRSFKAVVTKYVFRQKDNNGLFCVDGYLSKLDYPINRARLDKAISKLNAIEQQYLNGTDCRVYLSIIPDKNNYLAPAGGYPYIPYTDIETQVVAGVAHDRYIPIADLLTLEDYYCTDQHWRQECITDIAERLCGAMTDTAAETPEYELLTVDTPFYGAYVGQAALPAQADTLRYLTNSVLAACSVTDYNLGSPEESSVYNLSKAGGRDPYEMFLNGATPLVVIENPAANTTKELVVFRDSFGSALVPLLVESYAKITVVDLRYMRSELLGQFIRFDRQDVLFLYSTLTLNNTIAMN